MIKNTQTKHIPVMLKEVTRLIDIKPGEIYLDATLGGAGYMLEQVNKIAEQGTNSTATFIGIDQDKEAINRLLETLKAAEWEIKELRQEYYQAKKGEIEILLANTNFENLKAVLENFEIPKVNSIVADLGFSQDQIESEKRGFSFQIDSPLDMRMDENLQVTAADLLNGLTKAELFKLFNNLADLNKYSRKLVNEIENRRKKEPILTTKQLVETIRQVVHSKSIGSRKYNKSPETGDKLEARVFQALRIAVNHELDSLQKFLPQAFEALDAKGKLIIVSFHSGEDRLVKRFFHEAEKQGKANILEELLKPGFEEIEKNPRSSSAKLRALQKN